MIKWIFFDVGTTLIDETEAYNHRIRETIEGTDITFEQFQEKRIYFARQNLRGDLEAMKFFGLQKTPWHKEDEVPYPDAKIFQCALEKAGCKAEEAVMIGDRLDNDIYPAKKLGMKTIWVKQGFAIYQKPESDEFVADYIVHDLVELKEVL